MTRIHRLLLCAYLGIAESDLKKPFPYVRILASNAAGRELLRDAKKRDDLILINAGETPTDKSYYRLECRCADLYTLFAAPHFGTICRSEQNSRIFLSK